MKDCKITKETLEYEDFGNCIDYGILASHKFAKYLLEEHDYKNMCTKFSYLNKGVYDSRLGYPSWVFYDLKNVDNLMKYDQLKNMLSYYFTINKDKQRFKMLKLDKRYAKTQYLIDELNYDDYHDKNIVDIVYDEFYYIDEFYKDKTPSPIYPADLKYPSTFPSNHNYELGF